MKKNISTMKDVFYNTFGTFFYFFCQWLITVLVVRISGYHDAGILSIIISTTNLFYCIALFGVRNYQVSDVEENYTDNQYIFLRLITISISLIFFSCSLFIFHFELDTFICCMIYIFYKCGEAFSDVLFGCYQKYHHYKDIAISYTLKGVLTVITFILILAFTESLALTLLANIIAYYFIICFYDLAKLKKCFHMKLKRFDCKALLKICFPLMLYSCMVPYLNFITRFIIEKQFGTEILGYYSSVTMVFVVMSTLMGSIFVTVIPNIASYYQNHNMKAVNKSLRNLVLMIFLLAIIACIMAYLLGDFMFSIVFGKAILDYMYLLIPTILASIALTYTTLFSSILVSFRENTKVLYCNLISVIICSVIIMPLVNQFELLGTLYSLIISLSISSILLIRLILKKMTNHSHDQASLL